MLDSSIQFYQDLTVPYDLAYWESSSLGLLRKATSSQGIKASCTSTTNYDCVFTRDAVMAGIAGLIYYDELIISGLISTIEMLYKTRGHQGQIASNYKTINNQIEHISFGTLSPKIDSATWYLIAIGLLMNKGFRFDISYVESTVELLDALEYNGNDLLYIPQGGNWADEYPYEGYILYDQVLRSWALKLLGTHFTNQDWLQKAKAIKEKIDKQYFNKSKGYYNCTFTPSETNCTFDFAAHTLLGFLDDQDKNTSYKKSISWITDHFTSKGELPFAFHPVIDQQHAKWKSLSNFHLFEFKNKPYHYHNGGIWFIWLGWYALSLHKHKDYKNLHQLIKLSFDTFKAIDDFHFEEYLSGDTKQPNGTKELCYTATGILFLCKALKQEQIPIDIF